MSRNGTVLSKITAAPPLDAPATLTPQTRFIEDPDPAPEVNHYEREWKGVKLDVYRICKLYGIADPAVQHALKKLLRFGEGRHKSRAQDIREAAQSLRRWLEMLDEEEAEV